MRRLTIFLVAITFFITWAGLAAAQQQYVFPQKGQSAEQQKKDEYECHSWAVKQTGYDPTAAAQAPPQQAAQHHRLRGYPWTSATSWATPCCSLSWPAACRIASWRPVADACSGSRITTKPSAIPPTASPAKVS